MRDGITIEITDLAFGGAGVGRIDGKACFVDGALPGETVQALITADKGNYYTARTANVQKRCPRRITAPCPYYEKCGGCQYQHASYDLEFEYKDKQARATLAKTPVIEEGLIEPITPSLSEYEYRSSITLHRSGSGYGFYGADGKTVIPITQCLLAETPINTSLQTVYADSAGAKEITIKCNTAGHAYISSKHSHYTDVIAGVELTFSPSSFTQANRAVTELLVQRLRTWIGAVPHMTLFDLYCGCGLFSFLAGDLFMRAFGIDNNEPSIACANASNKRLKRACKFIVDDVLRGFFKAYSNAGTGPKAVIVDPPRPGLHKNLIEIMRGLKDIERVFYVSCNPATLARDLLLLCAQKRFTVKRAAAFDMFPRTKHIECLVELA